MRPPLKNRCFNYTSFAVEMQVKNADSAGTIKGHSYEQPNSESHQRSPTAKLSLRQGPLSWVCRQTCHPTLLFYFAAVSFTVAARLAIPCSSEGIKMVVALPSATFSKASRLLILSTASSAPASFSMRIPSA